MDQLMQNIMNDLHREIKKKKYQKLSKEQMELLGKIAITLWIGINQKAEKKYLYQNHSPNQNLNGMGSQQKGY